MSRALYRLGPVRRPPPLRASIGVVARRSPALVVVASASAFGQRPRATPSRRRGSTRRRRRDLLDGPAPDQAGLTAQVVVTPRGDGARSRLGRCRDRPGRRRAVAAGLPHVLGTTDPAGDAAVSEPAPSTRGAVSAGRAGRDHPRPVPGDRGARRRPISTEPQGRSSPTARAGLAAADRGGRRPVLRVRGAARRASAS